MSTMSSVDGQVSGKAPTNMDSEDSNALFCDPCYLDNRRETVDGFCLQCQHHLCEPCFKVHCQPLPSRHHQLLDKTSMPKVKDSGYNVNTIDANEDKCPHHTDRALEFYCEHHGNFGCSVCVIMMHQSCKVTFINGVVDNLKQSEEYKTLQEMWKAVYSKVLEANAKLRENELKINECAEKSLDDIKQFRAEINTFFDVLENQIVKNVNFVRARDSAYITKVSRARGILHEDLIKIQEDISNLKAANKKVELFSALKHGPSKINVFAERLEQITTDNKVPTYKFIPSGYTRALMQSVTKFGHLDKDDCPERDKQIPIPEHQGKDEDKLGERKPSKVLHLNSFCDIRALLLLDNGYLLAPDSNHRSVVILDTYTNHLTTRFRLPAVPFGMSEGPDDKIVVTLPDKQLVHILKFSPYRIETLQTLKTPGPCFGVACHNDTILLGVSCGQSCRLDLVRLDGELVKSIPVKLENPHTSFVLSWLKWTASCPKTLLLHSGEDKVYMVDVGRSVLVEVGLDGNPNDVHEVPGLKRPSDISAGSDGTVFVFDKSAGCIYELSPGCDKMQKYIQKWGGMKDVGCIAYSEKQQLLFVVMRNSKVIKAFRLSRDR